MNRKKIIKYINLVYLFFIISCYKPMPATDATIITPSYSFAKGADISWLTEMQDSAKKFYDTTGVETNLLVLLKNRGMNTVRLRVWVNPSTAYNTLSEVIYKAQQAKNQGMQIMIDFHYSDTWADPANQATPASWANYNLTELKTALYNYTFNFLNSLKTANIEPTWVQIGNEINDGFLWPTGKASSNMYNFSQLINQGYYATKAVFANSKVIVHLSNGWDNSLYRWLFDGLQGNGGLWDAIGMSLYPSAGTWATTNAQCLNNMNDMVTRYNKPIMISEIGMPWVDSLNCYLFIKDLITKVKSLPNNFGLGVLYWEPQSYNNWKGYSLGAFNNFGMPTSAISAFRD